MAYFGNYPYANGFMPQVQPSPVFNPVPSQASAPVQATGDDRIWVTSAAAAEAYPLVANGFVRLWDSNAPVYYEKRADANGRPFPLVAYEYKVKDTAPSPEPAAVDYEPKIKEIEERMERLEKMMKKPATSKKGEDEA